RGSDNTVLNMSVRHSPLCIHSTRLLHIPSSILARLIFIIYSSPSGLRRLNVDLSHRWCVSGNHRAFQGSAELTTGGDQAKTPHSPGYLAFELCRHSISARNATLKYWASLSEYRQAWFASTPWTEIPISGT